MVGDVFAHIFRPGSAGFPGSDNAAAGWRALRSTHRICNWYPVGAKLSAKQYPGIMLEVSVEQNGDIDRERFLTKVVNGKQVVTETLPPATK